MSIWVVLERILKVGQVPEPNRPPAVNQFTIKFLVGLIAVLLPFAELALTGGWGAVTSISESYWFNDKDWPRTIDWLNISDWPRTVFTGFLFAITALLLSFNGEARAQGILARVASAAAACIALFPCACRCGTELIGGLHYVAAGIMYAVLAWFCLHFMARAHQKVQVHGAAAKAATALPIASVAPGSEDWKIGVRHGKASSNAKWRRNIYAGCLVGMIASIFVLALQKYLSRWSPALNPVFVGEAGGLISFGISWITASRVVPVVTTKGIDRETLF